MAQLNPNDATVSVEEHQRLLSGGLLASNTGTTTSVLSTYPATWAEFVTDSERVQMLAWKVVEKRV